MNKIINIFTAGIVLFYSISVQSQSSENFPVLKHYDQDHLLNISLPMGGIDPGTVGLGGRGDLRDWAIMNSPAPLIKLLFSKQIQ
jgi:hypothetical protein